MSASSDDLRKRFEQLDDGELVDIYMNHKPEYTDEAVLVIKDIINRRGLTDRILFVSSFGTVIDAFAERVCECSLYATNTFWEQCKHLSDNNEAACDPHTFDLLSIMFEFTCLFLFMTDCRLSAQTDDEKRFALMDSLLSNLIIKTIEGYSPDSSEVRKEELTLELSKLYAARVMEYSRCDELAAAGDDTIKNNFMYAFGKRLAKLSGNQGDLRIIMEATNLGVSHTAAVGLDAFAAEI